MIYLSRASGRRGCRKMNAPYRRSGSGFFPRTMRRKSQRGHRTSSNAAALARFMTLMTIATESL